MYLNRIEKYCVKHRSLDCTYKPPLIVNSRENAHESSSLLLRLGMVLFAQYYELFMIKLKVLLVIFKLAFLLKIC